MESKHSTSIIHTYSPPKFPPSLTTQDLISSAIMKLNATNKRGKTPNAFMAYRMAFQKELSTSRTYLNMRQLSGIAGKLWRQEPEYVKAKYKEMIKNAEKEFDRIAQVALPFRFLMMKDNGKEVTGESEDGNKSLEIVYKEPSLIKQTHHNLNMPVHIQDPDPLNNKQMQAISTPNISSILPFNQNQPFNSIHSSNLQQAAASFKIPTPLRNIHSLTIEQSSSMYHVKEHNQVLEQRVFTLENLLGDFFTLQCIQCFNCFHPLSLEERVARLEDLIDRLINE
ncbi:hypothetical protein G9A89_005819 [Geosiphon pyriformis]|nr:hypothetical protein G9A89_005819 [Geosiphon pyriformis]